MEIRYDPRYCPQCYQYDGGTGTGEACRACFGSRDGKPETSFEAAFVMLADVDGGIGGDIATPAGRSETDTEMPRREAVEPLRTE